MRPEPEKRDLGQFFTPPRLAAFIASFFTRQLSDWRVIDAGAGRGDFTDSVRSSLLPWSEVVSPTDEQIFIRLPASDRERSARLHLAGIAGRLSDLGLAVSTGKVVDFRVRVHLRSAPDASSHPLIYPVHFEAGLLRWPILGGKKPNGIQVPPTRTDLLVPAGVYPVVRRFSSKEEKKRIVAGLLDPRRLPPGVEWIGIENHLNFFHVAGRGLPLPLAIGLVAYLNWSVVDAYFRHFNGHTQVNATDLRSLPFPPAATLTNLGAEIGDRFPCQTELDTLVATRCRRLPRHSQPQEKSQAPIAFRPAKPGSAVPDCDPVGGATPPRTRSLRSPRPAGRGCPAHRGSRTSSGNMPGNVR